MLYAVNDDNTDQDAGRVETPTTTEDNDKLVPQELQNNHRVPSLNVLQTSKHI